MRNEPFIAFLKAAIGAMLAWSAVATAALEAAVSWPKWLLVPAFLAFALGFFASALRS
jgi:hypothetical protein